VTLRYGSRVKSRICSQSCAGRNGFVVWSITLSPGMGNALFEIRERVMACEASIDS